MDVLGSVTFAVVFSGSLPAAPVVCTGFPPPCCTPLFIFSHIVGLCIHVACRVEWRPVSLFRVALGRMLGCGVPVSGLFMATLGVWVPVGMLPRPTQRF